MVDEHVVELMNKYMETKAQILQLETDKKKLIEQAMPKEVRDRVGEIEEEFAGKSEKAEKDLTKFEESIKAEIVSLQHAVAVKGLKATYHPGRVSWDAKGLEEVVKSNPEIEKAIGKFKKQGKGYAAFRFDKE